jgi:hypothetical protein
MRLGRGAQWMARVRERVKAYRCLDGSVRGVWTRSGRSRWLSREAGWEAMGWRASDAPYNSPWRWPPSLEPRQLGQPREHGVLFGGREQRRGSSRQHEPTEHALKLPRGHRYAALATKSCGALAQSPPPTRSRPGRRSLFAQGLGAESALLGRAHGRHVITSTTHKPLHPRPRHASAPPRGML